MTNFLLSISTLFLCAPLFAQTGPPACPNIPNAQNLHCAAWDKWIDARIDAKIAAQTSPAPSKAASPPTTGPFHMEIINAAYVPFDVPPITEEYGKLGMDICAMGCLTEGFIETNTPPWPGAKLFRRTRLTCVDKRRFLMTAEDGSHHCLALSPQPKGGSH